MKYGNFMAICPTTRFEIDALRYLKYDLFDEYGQMDIEKVYDGSLFCNFLERLGKVERDIAGDIVQIATPSNADVLCLAYSIKGKHRKVAVLRKKRGCNLPPVGFQSWEHYDEHHGWF